MGRWRLGKCGGWAAMWWDKKGFDELKYDNDKVKCYGYNDNRRECVEKLEICLS